MPDDFELDPEKKLWKPSRRSFFFGLGAALIAPMLPSVPVLSEIAPIGGWQSATIVTPELVMKEMALAYMNNLKLASHISRRYSDEFTALSAKAGKIKVHLPVRFSR